MEGWLLFCRLVCQVTDYFTENEIAHNLTITRGNNFKNPDKTTLRIFLWPRKAVHGKIKIKFAALLVG